jgi:hypothetical protein
VTEDQPDQFEMQHQLQQLLTGLASEPVSAELQTLAEKLQQLLDEIKPVDE